MKYRPVKFPEDELAHRSSVEWWYWNGRLRGKNGREYAFMSCLFKTNVKRVKVPFLARLPFRKLYFYHAIVSDLTAKKWHSSIEIPTIVSDDSFSKPLLFVNHTAPVRKNGYVNHAMEEIEPGVYILRDRGVDLRLISGKPPLLEGGKGFVDLKTKKTFYYSLTGLRATGRIMAGGKWVEVSGKAWMDHQWSDAAYTHDRWSWFSIQLDGGTELVCCEYEDRGKATFLASIMLPDGRQEECGDVGIVPLGPDWVSPQTKARYPTEWRITSPSKKIDLAVKAVIRDQEMVFGPINYWEGPVDVRGRFYGKRATGAGFMELAGYPTKYTDAHLAAEDVEKKFSRFFKDFKKGILG